MICISSLMMPSEDVVGCADGLDEIEDRLEGALLGDDEGSALGQDDGVKDGELDGEHPKLLRFASSTAISEEIVL